MHQGHDRGYQLVAHALAYLVEHAERQPSLAELATYVGISPVHCQRLFKAWAGVSPKVFLQKLTLLSAKAWLEGNHSVLTASLAAGLSGKARLHDLFLHYEAMTPGEYKNRGAGLEIRWGQVPSPLGNLTLAMTGRGICSLTLGRDQTQAAQELKQRWPGACLIYAVDDIAPLATLILQTIKAPQTQQIPLVLKGSRFQVKVWEALLQIPYGRHVSYGDIAAFIGAPKAARAVGTAVGANPIAMIVPCHRVIKGSGIIGDYRWGAARKRMLLALEAAHATGHPNSGHRR